MNLYVQRYSTHCNRKIGLTLNSSCKPGEDVMIFPIGGKPNRKFRISIPSGEALDKLKKFNKLFCGSLSQSQNKEVWLQSVCNGCEPYFVVLYGDVKAGLLVLSHMLDM